MNPKKLLNSKWTAATPLNKEKHFVITAVKTNPDTGEILDTTIEAVISKREYSINWRDLSHTDQWLQGWK